MTRARKVGQRRHECDGDGVGKCAFGGAQGESEPTLKEKQHEGRIDAPHGHHLTIAALHSRRRLEKLHNRGVDGEVIDFCLRPLTLAFIIQC